MNEGQIRHLIETTQSLTDQEKLNLARQLMEEGPAYYDATTILCLKMLQDDVPSPWYSHAITLLGQILFLEKMSDARSAMKLYEEYAYNDKTDPEIQGMIGLYYLTGEDGFPQDAEKGIKWLAIAGERGDERSIQTINILYDSLN